MLPEKCPNCSAPLKGRNIIKKVQETITCAKCGKFKQERTGESFSDDDAMALGNLSTIETWISKLKDEKFDVQPVVKESLGGYLWVVKGVPKWICEIRFNRSISSRFDICLLGQRPVSKDEDHRPMLEKLFGLCAAKGLQGAMSDDLKTMKLGPLQAVAVQVSISEKIFAPILKRLREAMEDVAKEFELS